MIDLYNIMGAVTCAILIVIGLGLIYWYVKKEKLNGEDIE